MRLLTIALPLLLAACGGSDQATSPGGVTADEAQALNDAAVMLDQNAMSANAIGTDDEDDR